MSKKVTYAEIIEALSRKTGFSKQKSEAFSKALIAQVKEELQETGKASITNFGSFKIKEVAERQGQNPQTGEPITIPAHKRVSFSPYKALREEVNAQYAHLETELIEEGGYENESEEDEIVPVPEKPPFKSNKPESKRPERNTGLIIIAILALVVVAAASTWFLLSSDEQELASEQAAVQEPQTPEAAAPLVEDLDSERVSNTPDEQHQPESEAATEEPVQTENVNPEAVDQTATGTVSTDEVYQVRKDEWYWVISRNVYGKAHFWPLIFEANFTRDTHPDSLETGASLKIPALSGTSDNLTTEDYAKLASGATLVSSAYENFGRRDKAKEYARYAEKWGRMSR